MKLSFKLRPNINSKQLEIIEETSYHTTKMYNIISYDLRENSFKNYYAIEEGYKNNWHCDFLHSHTRQQTFKVLEQNWKGYFTSIKDFGVNPSKYKMQEESYTSGCSAIDLEPITKKCYNKSRRITRGLFKSSLGVLNAEINGSLNILRKAEKCIPDLVQTLMDKGNWTHPERIRVAY